MKEASFALREDLVRQTVVRWVQGVVVPWSDFPAGVVKSAGIFYVHGDKLRAWLERQPPELTPDAVARVSNYLEQLEACGFGPYAEPAQD